MRKISVLFILAITLAATAAGAAETYWTYDGSGDWANTSNWDNGVPDSDTDAIINNGGTARLYDGNSYEVHGVDLGRPSAGETGAVGIAIAYDGSGYIEQALGQLAINGLLSIGFEFNTFGSYLINSNSANTLTLAPEYGGAIDVGGYGQGEFIQNGGSVITGGLYVNNGYYQIYSASLEATDVYVGGDFYGGTATMDIDELAYVIVGNLTVGSGGYLSIDDSAIVEVYQNLIFEDGCNYDAWGSTISMTGSNFFNSSTNASDLSGLEFTTLIFKGGAGVVDTLEVAGAVGGGFVDNFTIGSLIIGHGGTEGHVKLLDDDYNGSPMGGSEALFLGEFEIAGNSSFDLNGFLVFVGGDFADQWNDWIDLGLITDGTGADIYAYYDAQNDWTTLGTGAVVPEPGTIAMIIAGAAGLVGFARRKK